MMHGVNFMNIKEENEKLISFWNQAFEQVKPMELKKEDAKVETEFDRLLKFMGDSCERLIDVGSGWGYCLILSKLMGNKIKEGIGLDASKHAIDVLNGTCEISNISGLKGIVGTHEVLKSYEDGSFDGVTSSNFLDVIPEETSDEAINEIKRIIKPNGYLLLKFNFYLTEEIIKSIKMDYAEKNTYKIGGVIRGVNHTTDEWLAKFDGFELIEKTEFERVKNGPKDRVILLKKI